MQRNAAEFERASAFAWPVADCNLYSVGWQVLQAADPA